MKFVAVLPSIYPIWTERCLRSCAFANNVLVLDNTGTNRGVAASWNLGVDLMEERNADWLVIMSSALRFGDPGGMDFIDRITGPAIGVPTQPPVRMAVEAHHGIGWHLIAFSAQTFADVGRFDENFWPAYNEDVDFSRRCWLTYNKAPWVDGPWWQKVSVDVAIAGFAHGVDLGGVHADWKKLNGYYIKKWGGEKQHEKFILPFGTDPLTFWPHEGDGRSIIGVT
jgi:hypothetical protein